MHNNFTCECKMRATFSYVLIFKLVLYSNQAQCAQCYIVARAIRKKKFISPIAKSKSSIAKKQNEKKIKIVIELKIIVDRKFKCNVTRDCKILSCRVEKCSAPIFFFCLLVSMVCR